MESFASSKYFDRLKLELKVINDIKNIPSNKGRYSLLKSGNEIKGIKHLCKCLMIGKYIVCTVLAITIKNIVRMLFPALHDRNFPDS